MKLLRIGEPGSERPAIIDGSGSLRDLSGHIRDVDASTYSEAGIAGRRKLDLESLPLAPVSARIGPCVTNVGKFPHGNHKIPPAATIRRYPVVEKHSIIWVWMGDRPPQPEAIPDFSILDSADPGMVSKRDYIVMKGNYAIITDNLLDLSDVNVLHDGLLGNAKAQEAEIEVDLSGETVTVSRLAANVPVPKIFDLSFRQNGQNVDTRTQMRWDVPGCLLLESGASEPGSGKAAGTKYLRHSPSDAANRFDDALSLRCRARECSATFAGTRTRHQRRALKLSSNDF